MGALFARDFANAERGHYPLPRDHDGTMMEVIEPIAVSSPTCPLPPSENSRASPTNYRAPIRFNLRQCPTTSCRIFTTRRAVI